MRASIIVPPTNDMPPRMPVEGAVIAETLDALGWKVWVLDVAAYNMTADAVRLETKKEEPDMVVFMSNRNQYRFAKQYAAPIIEDLPHSLSVASTDLNPLDVTRWLGVHYSIRGYPVGLIQQLSSRCETKNLDGLDSTELEAHLPKYHPLTSHFERHAMLRNGRYADIPTKIFGHPVPYQDALEAVGELRLKYAMQGFNLLGPLNVNPDWLIPFLRGLEDRELVGAPANITWTCELENPMMMTAKLMREIADHGCKVLTVLWRPGAEKQLEEIIQTATRAGVQPIIAFWLASDRSYYEYVQIAKFLTGHEGVPCLPKFAEDENRLREESYVASLSNGSYLPEGTSIHRDMKLIAARDFVLNHDLARLEALAKET